MNILFLFSYLSCLFGIVHAAIPFQKILIIVMENADYADVSAYPHYKRIAKMGIKFTNFHALSHPSQPNYLGLISGKTWYDDNDMHNINAKTVVDLLQMKNLTWRGYMENMPRKCYLTEEYSNGLYARRHNPFASFTTITKNQKQCANIVPASLLYTENLPNFALYTPNNNNNGHDTSLDYSGQWLVNFLRKHSNKINAPGQLVVITFDESESSDDGNRIYTVLLGGAVSNAKKGTTDGRRATLYSILKSVENNWKLPSLQLNDRNALIL